MTKLFLALFLAAGAVNFALAVHIVRTLAVAGVRVGFYELRWQLHRHLGTYRRIAAERGGRSAWPLYGYWGSLAMMVLFGTLSLASLTR